MFTLDDTIAAIATPPGRGGVGVIRISGEEAHEILQRIFRAADEKMESKEEAFLHARMLYGRIVDRVTKETLDYVLAVRFFGPHSFTGEPTAEIHAHGGRKNLERILAAIYQEGARAAKAGEFTLRAFLNGKMDLTKAEAVGEIIDAQTSQAAMAAGRHLTGEISDFCEALRGGLIDILAEIEAWIDFPEESLPPARVDAIAAKLSEQEAKIEAAIDSYERGCLLFQGVEVLLTGAVNVGKSSLLNRISAGVRAIVSDTPGTTRDAIEAMIELSGMPVKLVDTAGLSEQATGVEAVGVALAKERIEKSDIILWVLDASCPMNESERAMAALFETKQGLVVLNKIDIADKAEKIVSPIFGWPIVKVSAKTGEGIKALLEKLSETIERPNADTDEILVTKERHKEALGLSLEAITRARALLAENSHTGDEALLELLAADLHDALQSLGEIVGLTTPEEILKRIFNNFCIGK